MASGDLVQIIFPVTAVVHSFTPAVGVSVMITAYGNLNTTWGGYASATYPYTGTQNRQFNGANSQYSNWKIPVTNSIFFAADGGTSHHIALGGVEL